jgi:hypothetical protein
MSQGDIPEPREAIDVRPAAHISEQCALAPDKDERLGVVNGMMQRMEQVRAVKCNQGFV